MIIPHPAERNKSMVYEVLKVGEINALSPDYLRVILGFKSNRALQKQIEKERGQGKVILSSTQPPGGYYLPDSPMAIRKFCITLENRRMFSLDVVDTDIFLDLPISSQALYFHLGMRADDDGFVSSPKRVTAMIGANQDDLKLLIAKGFVIVLEGGVVVIRHWKQNNYIQSDRHKDTIYQSQMAALTVNNGIYEVDTECIQTVSEMDTQN